MKVQAPGGFQAPTPPPASDIAARPKRAFIEVMGEGRAPAKPSAPPVNAPAAKTTGPRPTTLRGIMEKTVQAENKIDAIIKAAQSGKTFTAGELIAMQAQVFRYSQTVEVISRATDKLVGAVKQTLGTQV